MNSVIVAALLATSLATARAQERERQGSLEARVLQSETQRPMAEASVVLVSRDGTRYEARTDVQGRALVNNVPEGLYTVLVSATGRLDVEEPSVRIVANRILPIDVALQPPPEETWELKEMRVTSKALPTDPFGTVSESSRNREELRVAPGAGSDVLRALDGLPGLLSTGEFASYSVRGRGPRDNLIVVDGMPFDKVVHFDQSVGDREDIDGGGRYSIFAPETIAGATFSPGGWTAAYGGRSGSLLQLDVASGSPTPRSSLRIDLAGLEFLHEGPSGFDPDTSLLFAARQFDFGQVFEIAEEQDQGTPELTDVILKSKTKLGSGDTVELLAIYATEDYVRDVDNAIASENFEDLSLIDSSQDVILLGASWRHLFGDSGRWTNRVYFRSSDKTSSEGEAFPDLVAKGTPAKDVPVRRNILSIDEKETEIGWRSDVSLLNRLGSLSAGLHVSDVSLKYKTTLAGPWDRFIYDREDARPPGQDYVTLQPGDMNSRLDRTELSWAAYVEQVLEQERWDLRAGLRYDQDGFSSEGYVSPRLAFNYRLGPDTRLSASAGLFYQSPRYFDRAAAPANRNLANERITHLSAGFTHQINDRWSVLVEAYAQKLDDRVTQDALTNGTLSNHGEGTNAGIDVVLARKFARGLSGNITYSYNNLRIDDNDGLGKYDGDNNRPHFVSVGGSWEISKRWLMSARMKWASGLPEDGFIIHDNVLGAGGPLRYSKELTTRNSLRADDYFALNLRVDYRRSLRWFELVAFIDVINVLGGGGASPAEFNPRTGLNVPDEEEALPLFGLILEKNW